MTSPHDPGAPGPVSPYDRVQDRPTYPVGEPRRGRVPTGVWVVAAVAVVVVGALLWPRPEPDADFLGALDETADVFVPEVVSTRPADAQAFVTEVLGWSIPPPDLPALAIVGAGVPVVTTVRPSAGTSETAVQVPVYRYESTAGVRVHVFVYDYILLDQLGGALDLPDAVYAVLSEPTPVDNRVVGDTFVVTWRDRAILFSALTDDPEVAGRIQQAASS